MKKLRFLSGVAFLVTAFLFGGCYTQLEMRSNTPDNYGYNNQENQNNGSNQTSADSAYGSQYGDQNGGLQDSTNYYGSGNINNYNFNTSPYWNDWYNYPILT